jgi:hypothetical protein
MDAAPEEAIRTELKDTTRRAVQSYAAPQLMSAESAAIDTIAENILVKFVTIMPEPEDPFDEGEIREIILDDPYKQASSTKWYNAIFNWKALTVDAAAAALMVAGVVTLPPFFIPLAGLVIMAKLRSDLKVTISSRHAAIIRILGSRNKTQSDNTIAHDLLLRYINDDLKLYEIPEMSDQELVSLISDLEEFDCIGSNDSGYWLKESVKYRFRA